jgi:hypothetical protein
LLFLGFPKSTRDQKVIPKSMQNVTSETDGVLGHPTGSKKRFNFTNESLAPTADITQNFPNMNFVEVLQDFDTTGRGLKFFKGIEREDIDWVLNVAMVERQRYKEFMGCLNEFITQGKLTLATLPNWQRNEKTTQVAGSGQLVIVKSSKNLGEDGRLPVSQTAGLSWNNGAGPGGG